MYIARTFDSRTINRPLPPRDVVDVWIDKEILPGHWTWTDGFYLAPWLGGDALPMPEEAQLRWTPIGVAKPLPYSVIRLLFLYDDPQMPLGAKILNTCGRSTCVWPAHWSTRKKASVPIPVLVSPAAGRGRPRGYSPGKWSDVHVVDFDRGSDITACGRTLDGIPKSGLKRLRKVIKTSGYKDQVTCPVCKAIAERNPHWNLKD